MFFFKGKLIGCDILSALSTPNYNKVGNTITSRSWHEKITSSHSMHSTSTKLPIILFPTPSSTIISHLPFLSHVALSSLFFLATCSLGILHPNSQTYSNQHTISSIYWNYVPPFYFIILLLYVYCTAPLRWRRRRGEAESDFYRGHARHFGPAEGAALGTLL